MGLIFFAAHGRMIRIALKTIKSYVRSSALSCLAVYCAYPLYRHCVQGIHERTAWTLGSLLVHTGLYVVCNSFFYLIEQYGVFEQYRLPRRKAQLPPQELQLTTLKEAFMGQCVIGPFVAWYAFPYAQRFGMPPLAASLPSCWAMMGIFAFARFFNEVAFYFGHLLLHQKPFYRWIHRKHHLYRSSIGIAAEHANPVEQVLSNQLPTVGGCILVGAHPLVFWVWLACRLQETYEAHSGYCFAGSVAHRFGLTNSEASRLHYVHHSANNGNLGAYWLDWLFGTLSPTVL